MNRLFAISLLFLFSCMSRVEHDKRMATCENKCMKEYKQELAFVMLSGGECSCIIKENK